MLENKRKLTHSEAGKLGALAYIKSAKEAKQKREEKYLLSPVLCKSCSSILSYDDVKRKKVFCNRSCAVTYNNSQREKKLKYYKCKNCGIDCEVSHRKQNKYCSHKCQQDYQFENKIKENSLSTKGLKKYLIMTHGHKCWKCNNSEWNGLLIPLELEHNDGNSENNDLSNLSILCPNCHAQTPTYKGANRGNGRHARRIRYAEGKSF